MSMIASAALLVGASCQAQPAEAVFKAGAAKIDITPTAEEMPAPFKTVADHIFVRALVLEEGSQRAVLVIADAPTIEAKVAADLTARIAAMAHAPVENVLVGATHTHNAVRVDTNVKGLFLPGSPKFVDRVTCAALEAVEQAQANIQPARAGFGTGDVVLVANRNQWFAEQHRYIDGVDRTGNEPIDRRLGVLKVETLAGAPIALLLNYAIEPVVGMSLESEISGDVPGAASRYIEDRYKGQVVAMFTIGAAGSPLYRGQSGSSGPDAHVLVTAMGTILGEEALATARDTRTSAAGVHLAGVRRTLECPGKTTPPLNLPNQCAYTAESKLPACIFSDKEVPPAMLHMGMLRIGDVAILNVDANVTPALWRRLSGASPAAETMLVALTYGPFHYVVDDAAYPLNTYEATATTARQGCAEQGLVDGMLEMMKQTR
jgi:neutral ceramidase